ncbi:MAG: TetR family transcriptional regulator [Polyangiaceae bacterium]
MTRKQSPRPRDAEATRAAILDAARLRFAADGYERATIRAIAAEAGIDPALVIRYFGNKEKLFAAAAELDLGLPDLSSLPRSRVGAALVAHFLVRWEADDIFIALLRAATTNEAAASRMRAVFAEQVGPLVASLSGSAAEAQIRAGLVSSQILGMALCRYVLNVPPLVGMKDEELVGWMGPTIQRYLTGSAGK